VNERGWGVWCGWLGGGVKTIGRVKERGDSKLKKYKNSGGRGGRIGHTKHVCFGRDGLVVKGWNPCYRGEDAGN